MRNFYIKDMQKDSTIQDFYLVKNCGLKVGSNGKAYYDITITDSTGEISAKKWDIQPGEEESLKEIKDGDVVKVRALVTEWQGSNQLRINKIRSAVESDKNEYDITDLIKAAPEKPEDMYAYIYGVAENFQDEDLKKLCIKVLEDNKEKLMYYPAASKNHHAEYAGLLFHVKRMLMSGLALCDVYTELDKDLLCCGVIIHDIEKIDEILSNEYGISPGYSVEGKFLGHLVMGVKYLEQLTEELNIPREKALMLEHMVLSHHYEPEFGSPVRPLFPEAELLHYLDVIDAKLFDMFTATQNIEGGKFSEKIWTLNNRQIYKRK